MKSRMHTGGCVNFDTPLLMISYKLYGERPLNGFRPRLKKRNYPLIRKLY